MMICKHCGKKVTFVGRSPAAELYICTYKMCVTSFTGITTAIRKDVTRRCESCGKVIEGYSNKNTCSIKCRVKLHRKRRSSK
jgi:hypothetical protein